MWRKETGGILKLRKTVSSAKRRKANGGILSAMTLAPLSKRATGGMVRTSETTFLRASDFLSLL